MCSGIDACLRWEFDEEVGITRDCRLVRESALSVLEDDSFWIGYKVPVDLPTDVTRLFGRMVGGNNQRAM